MPTRPDPWTFDRRFLLKVLAATGIGGGLGAHPGSATRSESQHTRTLREGTTEATTLYVNDSGTGGMTVLVVGGMHGDERAGYVAAGDIQHWIPPTGTLLVLPRANIVGIENGTRTTGSGDDLNRQFPLEETPETPLAREIWDLVVEYEPDLVIDLHESQDRYTDGGLGQSVGYSPLRNLRGAAEISIRELNESIPDATDHFHQRFLPSPAEYPTGVFVQRTAFERGIPAYIIETYRDLPLTARVRWQQAHVRRLVDLHAAGFERTVPRHTLVVAGSGDPVEFAFDVTGTVSRTDTLESHDTVESGHVEGRVSTSEDHYQYTGRITSFEIVSGDIADITLSVDGETKTIDELTPAATSDLRITSSGSRVEYQLSADEALTNTTSLESNDWVFDDRAYGVVGDGWDAYTYERDIDHIDVTEGSPADLVLEVDGEPTTRSALDERPTHELWLIGTGPTTRYRVTVSGTIVATDATENSDTVTENSVDGKVSEDNDRYRFTGDIVSFAVIEGSSQDVVILVDGNEQAVSDLNPPDVHRLRVAGTGPTVRYTCTVSDVVYATTTAEDTDHVGIDRVRGEVSDGHDGHVFRGSVTSFSVTDGAFSDLDVSIDGQPKTLDELNPTWTEARTITADEAWRTHEFGRAYESAVVVAKPPSYNGSHPCHTRLRDVSDTSFEARIEEWLYQNDVHYEETVGTLAMAVGTRDLDAGIGVEAGRTVADTSWSGVSFEQSFHSRPIVLAQAQTERGGQPIVVRIADVSTDGFDARVQEEEAQGPHYHETIGFVAIEPGTGRLNGTRFEAGVTTLDEDWADLGFDRTYSNPVFLAGVQSFNGANTCSLRQRNLTPTGVEVKLEEEQSSDDEVGHVDETVGYLVLDGSEPVTSEARTIVADDPWQTYDLTESYTSPVVIAKPPSFNGSHPCHTRLRDVSDASFEARIEEWLYQNDVHYEESVGVLAMDAGTRELEGDVRTEVGRVVADDAWTGVAFDQSFRSSPVVLAHAQTAHGGHPIVTRIANVSTDGFDTRVQEEEAQGAHKDETLGYVAIEPGTGTMHGKAFEAGVTTLDESWVKLSFDRTYQSPVFLAGIQSFNGWNTCALRYRNLSGTGVEVKLEEEQSSDDETGHVDETVGYVVIEE